MGQHQSMEQLCHAHEANRYVSNMTFLSPLFKDAKTFVYRENDLIARTLAYMANPDLNMIAIQTEADLSSYNREQPVIYCDVHPPAGSERDTIITTTDRTPSQIIWNILTDDDYDSMCMPSIIKNMQGVHIPQCLDCCMKMICECDV